MQAEIHLRLYEELNDYLPPGKRKREFACQVQEKTTVREMLQTLGVPASEVEVVLVNGSSAGLSHSLSAGDRVSVYPVFESLNVKPLLRFREKPLRRIRFVVDPGLRRLAFYLRLLGFDAPVGSVVAGEDREILLTAEAELLNSGLSRIYVVRNTRPGKQLKEVLSRFDLGGSGEFSALQSMIARLLAF